MKKIITLGLVVAAPLSALAAYSTFDSIILQLLKYLNYVVPALITIAVIYFIWGVISYMSAGNDEEAKKMSRTKIINGLIGLFVIVAFWGIIGLVKRTFNIDNATGDSVVPCVPTMYDNCQ